MTKRYLLILLLLLSCHFLSAQQPPTLIETKAQMISAGIFGDEDVYSVALDMKKHFRDEIISARHKSFGLVRFLSLFINTDGMPDVDTQLAPSYVKNIFDDLNVTVSDTGKALTPKEIAQNAIKTKPNVWSLWNFFGTNTPLDINLESASLLLAVIESELRAAKNPSDRDPAWISAMAVEGSNNYLWVGLDLNIKVVGGQKSALDPYSQRALIFYAFQDKLPKAKKKFDAEPIPLDGTQRKKRAIFLKRDSEAAKNLTIAKMKKIDEKCLVELFNQFKNSAAK